MAYQKQLFSKRSKRKQEAYVGDVRHDNLTGDRSWLSSSSIATTNAIQISDNLSRKHSEVTAKYITVRHTAQHLEIALLLSNILQHEP